MNSPQSRIDLIGSCLSKSAAIKYMWTANGLLTLDLHTTAVYPDYQPSGQFEVEILDSTP